MDDIVICVNSNCDCYGDEVNELDKTNCNIHEGYELLEGYCKELIEGE